MRGLVAAGSALPTVDKIAPALQCDGPGVAGHPIRIDSTLPVAGVEAEQTAVIFVDLVAIFHRKAAKITQSSNSVEHYF